MFNPFSALMHHLLIWKRLTKDQHEWAVDGYAYSHFQKLSLTKPAPFDTLHTCTHSRDDCACVHVYQGLCSCIWYSDTPMKEDLAGGIKLEKKRGGIVEGRRRASLLQWQVYSLGTAAISCFHRVKNFSTVFFQAALETASHYLFISVESHWHEWRCSICPQLLAAV